VVVTHEMNVIKQICNKVAVIERSRVVEQGTTFEVFSRPKTQTARNFLKSVLINEIPEELKTKIKALNGNLAEGRVVKIGFFGETTGKPILSEVVKKYDVNANILFGNIDHIQGVPFGTLVVQFEGKNGTADRALGHLRELGLDVEVMEIG